MAQYLFRFFRVTLVILAIIMVVPSCKRKEATPPPPPTPSPVLQAGTGAVLVIFPDSSPAEDWMAQVNLIGELDTRSLPRTVLGDLHAVVVLNVPPATYEVTARSWNRRDTSVPKSGGRRTAANVTAGEVLILRARQLIANSEEPQSSIMTLVGSKPWQLTDANLFRGYVSGLIQETARG